MANGVWHQFEALLKEILCSSTPSPKNINNFNRILIAYKVEYSHSILIKATLDNLSWPMVILKYVFIRLKLEKDLSELQLVAGMLLNI